MNHSITVTADSAANKLARIAETKNVLFELYVASHEKTSAHTLLNLTKSSHRLVKVVLASRTGWGKNNNILLQLAQTDDIDILEHIAKNPECPPQLLQKLVQSGHHQVLCAVAINPASSKKLVDQLYEKNNEIVNMHLANHLNTSVEILHKLAESSNVNILYSLAKNPNCTTSILNKLLKSEQDMVRVAVLKYGNWTEEQLDELFEKYTDERFRVAVVQNWRCGTVTLEKAAVSEFVGVRVGAAENINISPQLADVFEQDNSSEVCCALARNPKVSEKVLAQLAEHYRPAVRAQVAENVRCPTEQLHGLSYETNLDVGLAAAGNPNNTQKGLTVLGRSRSKLIRKTVAQNPAASKDIVEELSRDRQYEVRESVAGRPDLTQEIIDRLSADSKEWVVLALMNNPTVDEKTINSVVANTEYSMLVRVGGAKNKKCLPELAFTCLLEAGVKGKKVEFDLVTALLDVMLKVDDVGVLIDAVRVVVAGNKTRLDLAMFGEAVYGYVGLDPGLTSADKLLLGKTAKEFGWTVRTGSRSVRQSGVGQVQKKPVLVIRTSAGQPAGTHDAPGPAM